MFFWILMMTTFFSVLTASITPRAMMSDSLQTPLNELRASMYARAGTASARSAAGTNSRRSFIVRSLLLGEVDRTARVGQRLARTDFLAVLEGVRRGACRRGRRARRHPGRGRVAGAHALGEL